MVHVTEGAAMQTRDETTQPGASRGERVKNEIRNAAHDLAGSGRETLKDSAENLKYQGAESLRGLADAVRDAGESLSRDGRAGPLADLAGQAARNLSEFSQAIEGRSTGEIVSMVRDFGRRNPVAFLAGSVLAGLALGRIATLPSQNQSRAPAASSTAPDKPSVAGPSAGATGAF
jgi:hypothetical protein